ncbi:RNA-guided endonuclease InsQ/TnpB family protein [Micromonospora inyonensis]|uniref:Putative transposase n=1 Tax=Micromonospora inyonensis TaxID=47866 RepID=A0A1C6SR80_9ACTN|nr:RNA-guided endonuclease TnpB family protein [Micromonospora inyonensis]SCL32124.1 putative transposase [Micromonospora inyonensis]
MRTAYRCRAYPTPEQAAVLNRTFGCVRVVWNRTLAARTTRWRTDRMSTSYAETDRALTGMKKQSDLAFLGEVSSVPLQQTLRHQHAAMTAFFAKRARYPRYKSRHGRQSASYTRSAFRLRDGRLSLGKTPGTLAFVWSRPDIDPAELNPTMVTVSRDPDGRWYVTLAVDIDTPALPEPTGQVVGVDLGLTDFAVLSTGERIPHPKHMERRERRLKRYQRMMARRQKGSANRATAKRKVARAHSRVRDARRDFLHQTSTALVRRFDAIAVEDLAVANMVRNRCLAKAISRTGWAEFRHMLTYKTQRAGRHLAVVDRWYPSSKTCSTCGHLLATLSSPSPPGWRRHETPAERTSDAEVLLPCGPRSTRKPHSRGWKSPDFKRGKKPSFRSGPRHTRASFQTAWRVVDRPRSSSCSARSTRSRSGNRASIRTPHCSPSRSPNCPTGTNP